MAECPPGCPVAAQWNNIEPLGKPLALGPGGEARLLARSSGCPFIDGDKNDSIAQTHCDSSSNIVGSSLVSREQICHKFIQSFLLEMDGSESNLLIFVAQSCSNTCWCHECEY